jgi:uncharacterized membrane protein YeaQ/YmgE (transglycosylase-associated protein family)
MNIESLIVFLVTGLLAGLLACALFKIPRPRLVGTLVLGCLGALLGGWLGGVLGIHVSGYLGQILLATVGTALVVWLLKFAH